MVPVAEVAHHVHEDLGVLAVEIRGRFVGEDQRACGDRSRDPLLAARQLAGPTVRSASPEFLKHRPRAVAAMLEPLKLQHEFDVFERGQHGHEIERLEHEPDRPQARSARSRRESVAIC